MRIRVRGSTCKLCTLPSLSSSGFMRFLYRRKPHYSLFHGTVGAFIQFTVLWWSPYVVYSCELRPVFIIIPYELYLTVLNNLLLPLNHHQLPDDQNTYPHDTTIPNTYLESRSRTSLPRHKNYVFKKNQTIHSLRLGINISPS